MNVGISVRIAFPALSEIAGLKLMKDFLSNGVIVDFNMEGSYHRSEVILFSERVFLTYSKG